MLKFGRKLGFRTVCPQKNVCGCKSTVCCKIKRMRYINAISLTLLIVVCSILYYKGEKDNTILVSIYKYITPCIYVIIVCNILLTDKWFPCTAKEKTTKGMVEKVVPYTFEFYLWHSMIYHFVTMRLEMLTSFDRYLATLIIGTVVTGYIAFLMTKMNDGIIKQFRL